MPVKSIMRSRAREEFTQRTPDVFRHAAVQDEISLVGTTAVITFLVIEAAARAGFSRKTGDDAGVDFDVAGVGVDDDIVGPQTELILRLVIVRDGTIPGEENIV